LSQQDETLLELPVSHGSAQQDTSATNSMPAWRLFLPAIISTVVAVAALAWLFQSGQRLASSYIAQADAVAALELQATRGHLWFEDLLRGGRDHNLNTVWNQLDQADASAREMLGTGAPEADPHPLVDDPAMREEVEAIRDRLRDYRMLAQRRLDALPGSLIVDDLDLGVITAFERVLRQAERVRGLLEQDAQGALDRFKHTAVVLMVLMLAVGIGVGVTLYRHDRARMLAFRSVRDASQKIQKQASALDYLAHFDTLTQLPNRTLFFDRLGQVLAHANRRNQWAVLMFLDLDEFKAINDSMGHALGDALLETTAERLTHIMREEDTIARLGGDEFTLLLPYQASRVEAMRSASMVAEKIMRSFRDPIFLDGRETHMTCSIGVALYPQDANNPEDLLKHADTAMYHAKQGGRNNYQFYSDEMNTVIRHRVLIEAGLQRALERSELLLYYQPLIDLATGVIVGAEALLRWQHPERGLLLPNRFIQVAEETGVVLPLGEWVIKHAAQQFLVWHGSPLPLQRMIINLCPIQFRHAEIVDMLRDAIGQYGLTRGSLEVDIAESTLMKDTAYSLRALRALKKAGVNLAVDDFGTGYSSIAFLKQFPVDTLKIHQSFVADLGSRTTGDPVVTAMVQFAHTLGLEVIAEGVETEEQRDILLRLGCERAQGNLLGPPMPADEFARLLSFEEVSNYSHT
jgi:diguanylate cyclase (GGDEF)-like protein